jgi:chemotaxis protein histidine kinase CheA
MRHAIETAPRDGKVVILEDDASGSHDVAHWSPEAGEWVGRDGEPSKITPTHWHPMSSDQYHPSQVGPFASRRRFSHFVDVIAAATLIGVFFYLIRDGGQPDIVRISEQVVAQATQLPSQNSKTALPAPWRTEANQASAPAEAQQAAQVQHAVASVPEARQSLNEERAKALAQELTEARRTIERLDLQLRAEAAKSEQSLEQEWQQTAALAQEAAAARQELTTSTAQHRQALDEERARSAALASELAMAQREIETQAAQLRKATEETGQFKQATEKTMAELRESLQQARDRTAAMARDLLKRLAEKGFSREGRLRPR